MISENYDRLNVDIFNYEGSLKLKTEKFGKGQRLMAASSAGIERRQAILEAISIGPEDRIIDIGCGGGHLVEQLALAVGGKGHIYGLDQSEDQLAQAQIKCQNFHNVSLIRSSADQIDLASNCCNTITSIQTFEYVENIDRALEEATRILKPGGTFVNISILWDHFKFFGAEEDLNELIHTTFKKRRFHQMLPMELPGKLINLGYQNIKNKSLAFVVTHRDQNSPAKHSEETMANFAITQGISKTKVTEWRSQLSQAEIEGRFGFTSFPVLTNAFLP